MGRTERAVRRTPTAALERLVDLARLAPSVHNTQPWAWRIDDGDLQLYADLARALPEGDPRGRNLTISCGAALHHLQWAAAALGWSTDVARLPTWTEPDLLARVRVAPGHPQSGAAEDLSLLHQRCTDRRRFTAWPVPPDRLADLCRSTEPWRVTAKPVIDGEERFRLEALVHRALGTLGADARHQAEQAAWIDRSGADGIPRTVLPAQGALLEVSRFEPGTLEDPRVGIGAGDTVIALGTEDDDVHGWLRTGEALSALWLQATREGLSVVPMSQPIEAGSVRREIRSTVLHDAFVPHLLLRVGWQVIGRRDLPRTPRRPLDDVLGR